MSRSAYETVRLARSNRRPTGLDFIRGLFTDFFELHGDRRYGDDAAVVGGLAELEGKSVTVIAVSKTKPDEMVVELAGAGVRDFGENKPQEAHSKWQELQGELPEARWCVIGHLQTNKARLVAQCASEFQALDSLRVAARH